MYKFDVTDIMYKKEWPDGYSFKNMEGYEYRIAINRWLDNNLKASGFELKFNWGVKDDMMAPLWTLCVPKEEDYLAFKLVFG